MSVHSPARLSPDDLLSLPDGKSYELVNGELVELKMSAESSWIAGQIHLRLSLAVLQKQLGWVFPEGTGFQCFPEDGDRVRKPDTSFVAMGRMPIGPPQKGYCRIAPDLAVEVVSPNDLAWEVDIKVNEWLNAGVSVVWLVMPRSRTVTVHRPDQDPHIVNADEDITLDLLPGFHCHVASFFVPDQKQA